MNLKDKIDAERQDEPLILLYMEGMFWKAYEQSAMRFTKEVKAYKLLKRFVKTVNSNVVSMGFPDGSLEDVLKGRAFTRVNDKLVSFYVDTAFTADEFETWKTDLPVEAEISASSSAAVVPAAQPNTHFPEATKQVLTQLAAFRVETASPLQCMLLVSDLQALLKQ